MNVVVEEARESYRCGLCGTSAVHGDFWPVTTTCSCCREEIVQVLQSNTVEEMDENVERIVLWLKQVTHQI